MLVLLNMGWLQNGETGNVCVCEMCPKENPEGDKKGDKAAADDKVREMMMMTMIANYSLLCVKPQPGEK